MVYCITLLRYIHQNPVKAGIVEHVKDYESSSWGEYDGSVDSVFQICGVDTVLNRIPFEGLDALVNEPLADDVSCIDIEDPSKIRPSDDQVWQMNIEKSSIKNASAFQQLDEERDAEGIEKAWCVSSTVREIDGNRMRCNSEAIK